MKYYFPNLPSKNDPEYSLQKKIEKIPGMLVWITLISPIIFSFFFPAFIAIMVILYDLYWLIKIATISVHLIIGYMRMKKATVVNWLKKCKILQNKTLNINEIYHLVVIPYSDEGLEILEPSIKSIYESNYPKNKIIISISSEARAGKEANQRQEILKKKYGHYFKAFLTNIHPNEKNKMQVKACNANFAVKRGIKYLKENKISFNKVIVSNFDCDTCIHSEYLAKVSFHFMGSPDRYRQSYQPLPMYNNNIWETISIARLIALGSTFWHIIECTRPERLVTFSSHSMSLKALMEVGFWQEDVISEDSAIFWQCYIYYDGKYKVLPIYLPVSMDATLSDSFIKTIINQYKQNRRWAYGVENFPRIFRAFLKNTKIPLSYRIRHLLKTLEGYHSWATSSLLILCLGWLPLILGGAHFNETVLSHSLPLITKNILTLAMLGLVLSISLTFILIPPKPKNLSNWHYFSMFFQWFLIPLIFAPIMGVPAIDSQTRLMLGKYFQKAWVSEKIRKK